MAKATEHSLSKTERALVAETQRAHLLTLDEDELIALMKRVRRARDKFVQLHRREVAGQVTKKQARGKASAGPRRSASKAEIFEDALSRVSTALAKASRQSAAALRAERLAMAAAAKTTAAKSPATKSPAKGRTAAKSPAVKPGPAKATRTAASTKEMASSRAQGARRQAARDSR